MQLQQSAKPYLLLLFVLLGGIPYSNHYLQQKQAAAALKVKVKQVQALPVAETEARVTPHLNLLP
jgi:hypothetical protein